jgi:hypothetical protein
LGPMTDGLPVTDSTSSGLTEHSAVCWWWPLRLAWDGLSPLPELTDEVVAVAGVARALCFC